MSNRKSTVPLSADAQSSAQSAADTATTLDALDPLLQHRSRLGAMVLLSTAESMNFSRLKTLLSETDGNLGAQLRKLEEATYLTANKAFVERKPTTQYAITKAGHVALKKHLDALGALIRTTQGA